MALELGWRRFNFFEKTAVPDPTDSSQKFSAFRGLDISIWAAADDFVLLGGSHGVVIKVEKDLQLQLWKAHAHSLTSLTYVNGFLATVGGDKSDSGSDLKLWNLNSWERNEPYCVLSSKLIVSKSRPPATAVSVAMSANLDMICVLLEDASVLYYYGDFTNERFLKWRLLEGCGNGKMVGIAIATLPAYSVVFILAENSVISHLMEAGASVRQVVHDAKGCAKNCWSFSPTTNTLHLANKDMVYIYDATNCLEQGNERGRCFGLARGVDKLQLLLQNHNVVLMTERPAIMQSAENSAMCVLDIYDVELKYNGFHCPMPVGCKLFVLDNKIYVITGDGFLHRVTEKSLGEKLDSLKKKNLFDVAIGLAKRHASPDLPHIYLKYGDYLYAKGDFENAVKQYMETIEVVEPSYVIKKFVDGSRIAQLCAYLERLHDKNASNGQHSILLLSTYIKLNEKNKIMDFVEKSAHVEQFNVQTAVKILRIAELYKVALTLARKHQLSELYLEILVDDLGEAESAIKFIDTEPLDKKCQFVIRFGPALIKTKKEAIVELVKELVEKKPEASKELVRVVFDCPDALEVIFKNPAGAGIIPPNDVNVRTALLERLLSKLQPEDKTNAEKLDEIYGLIQPDNQMDALQLGHQYNVPSLVVHIYRQTKATEDLLRYLLREGEFDQVIELCDDRILKDMWIELVTHVSRKDDLDSKDLVKLLDRAKSSNFIHPLVVLEILSRNATLKVADIKDYIVNWLDEQSSYIKNHEEEIRRNELEIEQMDKLTEALETDVQIFQATKCSACESALQVPAVHFLCQHAFHVHCFESFTDGKGQCPACVDHNQGETPPPKPKRTLAHLAFQDELQNSSDPVTLIADYIARGAFDLTPPSA